MSPWGMWSSWPSWLVGPVNNTIPARWDYGLRVHKELLEPPDMAADPLTLAFVRDQHLRVTNGTAEDEYIEWLIRTSYRMAERTTRRALIPQTWLQTMDAFPSGEIVLEVGPVVSIEAFAYIDEAGDEQTITASPADYEFIIPVGPQAGRATLRPIYGASWPTARYDPESVQIQYIAGYPLLEDESPAVADIPEDITHGRLLVIGEMYKQRSESVHAFNQNPAMIRARDIWVGYRLY